MEKVLHHDIPKRSFLFTHTLQAHDAITSRGSSTNACTPSMPANARNSALRAGATRYLYLPPGTHGKSFKLQALASAVPSQLSQFGPSPHTSHLSALRPHEFSRAFFSPSYRTSNSIDPKKNPSIALRTAIPPSPPRRASTTPAASPQSRPGSLPPPLSCIALQHRRSSRQFSAGKK